jgi:hypothetical protein
MTSPNRDGSIFVENAQIIFRNLAGHERQFNVEGDRNFCLLLTPEQADWFHSDGWNVKTTKERELDEGETVGGEPYIKVKVSYKGKNPPKVFLITERGKTALGPDELELVDFADIVSCDVMIRPYDWDVNGKTGRKAYLKSLAVTINEDEFDRKYADVKTVGTHFDGEIHGPGDGD